jgi:hypothetical protein
MRRARRSGKQLAAISLAVWAAFRVTSVFAQDGADGQETRDSHLCVIAEIGDCPALSQSRQGSAHVRGGAIYMASVQDAGWKPVNRRGRF